MTAEETDILFDCVPTFFKARDLIAWLHTFGILREIISVICYLYLTDPETLSLKNRMILRTSFDAALMLFLQCLITLAVNKVDF
jgi:hypothetical protein